MGDPVGKDEEAFKRSEIGRRPAGWDVELLGTLFDVKQGRRCRRRPRHHNRFAVCLDLRGLAVYLARGAQPGGPCAALACLFVEDELPRERRPAVEYHLQEELLTHPPSD